MEKKRRQVDTDIASKKRKLDNNSAVTQNLETLELIPTTVDDVQWIGPSFGESNSP